MCFHGLRLLFFHQVLSFLLTAKTIGDSLCLMLSFMHILAMLSSGLSHLVRLVAWSLRISRQSKVLFADATSIGRVEPFAFTATLTSMMRGLSSVFTEVNKLDNILFILQILQIIGFVGTSAMLYSFLKSSEV